MNGLLRPSSKSSQKSIKQPGTDLPNTRSRSAIANAIGARPSPRKGTPPNTNKQLPSPPPSTKKNANKRKDPPTSTASSKPSKKTKKDDPGNDSDDDLQIIEDTKVKASWVREWTNRKQEKSDVVASFNQELKNHMATEGTQKVRGDLSITLYRTNNVWIKEGKASVYSGYNGVSPHISTSTNPPKVPSALGKVNPEGALYELLSLNWVDKIGRVRPDGHCLYRCLVLQMVAFGLLAPKDELRQIQALRTALATLLENDTAYYFDHDYYAKQRLPTDVQTEITGIMCGGDTNKCGDLTAPVVQDSGVFWFRPTYHGHLFVDSKFAILVYMTRDDKVIEVYLPSKPEEDKSVGDWLLDLTVHCYLILATDSHAWDLRVANPDGIAFRAWLLAKYQQGVLEIHRGPGPKRRKAGGKGNGKKVPGA